MTGKCAGAMVRSDRISSLDYKMLNGWFRRGISCVKDNTGCCTTLKLGG